MTLIIETHRLECIGRFSIVKTSQVKCKYTCKIFLFNPSSCCWLECRACRYGWMGHASRLMFSSLVAPGCEYFGIFVIQRRAEIHVEGWPKDLMNRSVSNMAQKDYLFLHVPGNASIHCRRRGCICTWHLFHCTCGLWISHSWGERTDQRLISLRETTLCTFSPQE